MLCTFLFLYFKHLYMNVKCHGLFYECMQKKQKTKIAIYGLELEAEARFAHRGFKNQIGAPMVHTVTANTKLVL